jgi:hypothetical protein
VVHTTTGTEVLNQTSNSTNSTTVPGIVNPWYDYYQGYRDRFKYMITDVPPYVHGVMMWFAWTFFGLVQLVSGRYMGFYYIGRVRLHMVAGMFIFTLAFMAALFAWSNAGFDFHWTYHSITGSIVLV